MKEFYSVIKCKLYGCKSDKDAKVKIIEYYKDHMYNVYFGSYDKGIGCYNSWFNPTDYDVIIHLYIKIDDEWIIVKDKYIDKDNIDKSKDIPFYDWFKEAGIL